MRLNKKGFSLIELMVTILIVVIVLGLVAGLVGFSTKFFRDENSQILSQSSLRLIAVDIEKDIRRHVETEYDFYFDTGCLNIRTDLNVDNNIKYCLSGDLVIREANGTSVEIGSRISVFNTVFSSVDNSILLTITTKPDSRGMSNTIDFKVYIRTERAG